MEGIKFGQKKQHFLQSSGSSGGQEHVFREESILLSDPSPESLLVESVMSQVMVFRKLGNRSLWRF